MRGVTAAIIAFACFATPAMSWAASAERHTFRANTDKAPSLPASAETGQPSTRSGKTPTPLKHIMNEKPSAGVAGKHGSFEGIRNKAIRQAVYTYAVQSAAKWRYDQVSADLKGVSSQLDRVFDFSALSLVNGRVLPPVITEGRQGWRKIDDRTAQSVKHEFEILSPAKIITATPTWRTYLLKSYPAGDKPNGVLYPKNDAERRLWRAAARDGWAAGEQLAMQLYQTNLNSLKRDFIGMIMFHRLSNEHIVSLPSTAETDPRIKVNGETLSVGEHVFRITLPSQWKRVGSWTPGAALNE